MERKTKEQLRSLTREELETILLDAYDDIEDLREVNQYDRDKRIEAEKRASEAERKFVSVHAVLLAVDNLIK